MKQLDPKAVWLFFLSFVLRWLISGIILGFWFSALLSGINDNEPSFGFLNWLWILVPAFLILCYAWARLTYHYYRYDLTDAGFRKESGVISKRYVTIPYDRIQNVDIYRGITARILGLSDLQIQTAGASAVVSRYGAMGMGAEGRLPGLSKEVAEQVRDDLVQRARQPRNQGL